MPRTAVFMIIAATLLGGCKQFPNLGALGKVAPKVSFKNLKVQNIDFTKIDTKMVLEIENPYPVALKLADKSWTLGLAGSPFLDGADNEGLNIPANGTAPFKIPVSLKWKDAFALASAVKGEDHIPFDFHADLGFNTPVGPVRVPVNHKGELPALSAPKVKLKGLRVKKIDLLRQTASLALDLNVSSEQKTALSFEKFAYGIKLNDTAVADGMSELANLDGGEMTLPINLKLLELGASLVKAVTTKGSLQVALDADAEVGTPFGVIPLKIAEGTKLQLK